MFLCAALPNVQFSVEKPYESNTANVDTTLKTLIAAKNNGIKKTCGLFLFQIIYFGLNSLV